MADTFVFKGFLYDEDKILAKRNLEMGGAVAEVHRQRGPAVM